MASSILLTRGGSFKAKTLNTFWLSARAVLFLLFAGSATADKVLIFAPSVTGGTSSVEAKAATALGFSVDLVDAPTFQKMTTADFATYRALVFGDPSCKSLNCELP